MGSPFPGMDPYLEFHWGDVHASLMIYARNQLRTELPEGLRVRVEEQVLVQSDNDEGHGFYPDVRVIEHSASSQTEASSPSSVGLAEPLLVPMVMEPRTQRSIRIIDARTGNRLVTGIEFLSPSNKLKQQGRDAYQKKQREMIEAGVNLVEIDLIRSGPYLLAAPQYGMPETHLSPYRICVFRACRPESAEVYRVSLQERLPKFRIPLRETDADVPLELQLLIEQAYEDGGYEGIDYQADPVPPLAPEDAAWADALLREKGLR